MRDTILPQAQNQLDELANQMSQALSNQTTSGTAVTSGSQSGYSVDIGGVLPGNTLQLTYTDSSNVQHTVTVVALGAGRHAAAADCSANPNNPTIGVDFSGGMSSVVTQLNAALGTNLQFSNPPARCCRWSTATAATTVNSLSATTTATSLTSGSAQLPMFLDGTQPITGALTSGGSQTTGSCRAHYASIPRSSPRPRASWPTRPAPRPATRRGRISSSTR